MTLYTGSTEQLDFDTCDMCNDFLASGSLLCSPCATENSAILDQWVAQQGDTYNV